MQCKELIEGLKNQSAYIRVDHIKTKQITALESFQIIKMNDNTITCIRKSIVENIKVKNFKTLRGLKNYLIKEIKRYQQCTYVPIEFEIEIQ